MPTGVRSSISVVAGSGTDALRVSRKMPRRLGHCGRGNRSRQDRINAARGAGVARSRFVSSLREKGFLQLRRHWSEPRAWKQSETGSCRRAARIALPRPSKRNDSGVIRACCADTRWRNEELFADILRRRGGCQQPIRHLWQRGTSIGRRLIPRQRFGSK